jgi:preprotein translocase subunit SecA
MLKRRGIPHQVLNAKYHELEAQIIAQAGRYKGVTIATNMAGRGTDILLGGNPEFIARNVAKQKLDPADPNYLSGYKAIFERYKSETVLEHDKVAGLGGLHVLGTERHEARRIDNQLRGRSGRQGDPGSSRFYVSLRDDLMRLFGSDRIIGLMDKLGLEEGQVIEHPWVTGSIEIAQRRVEQHNFEIRKQLLEYDNVMNKQREIIYGQRKQILEGFSLKENIIGIIHKLVGEYLQIYNQPDSSGIDTAGLISSMVLKFGLELDPQEFVGQADQELKDKLSGQLLGIYEAKEKSITPELMRNLEGMVFLQIIDSKWKDHLYAMDSLREGIGLRAYGQRDPLIEYKREAFEMFSQMIAAIEEEAVETIFKLQPVKPDRFQGVFSSLPKELSHPESVKFQAPVAQGDLPEAAVIPIKQAAAFKPAQPHQPKVGRNDPCPCGSGKKYKKCCAK